MKVGYAKGKKGKKKGGKGGKLKAAQQPEGSAAATDGADVAMGARLPQYRAGVLHTGSCQI